MTDSVSFGGRSCHKCFHRRLRLSRPSATVCEPPPNLFRFFLVPPSLEKFRASSPLFDDETSRPRLQRTPARASTHRARPPTRTPRRGLVWRCDVWTCLVPPARGREPPLFQLSGLRVRNRRITLPRGVLGRDVRRRGCARGVAVPQPRAHARGRVVRGYARAARAAGAFRGARRARARRRSRRPPLGGTTAGRG